MGDQTDNHEELEELHDSLLSDVEKVLVEGLHEEEKSEWITYLSNALPRKPKTSWDEYEDYLLFNNIFEMIIYEFSLYLIDIVMIQIRQSKFTVHKEKVLEILYKAKDLFKDAIKQKSWNYDPASDIIFEISDNMDEMTEGGEFLRVVIPKYMHLYESLEIIRSLMRFDTAKATKDTVRFLASRDAERARDNSKAKEAALSRLLFLPGVDKRALSEYKKEWVNSTKSENKNLIRKYLSLLNKAKKELNFSS